MSCVLRPWLVHETVVPGSIRNTLGVNRLSVTSTSTSGYSAVVSALPRMSTTFTSFHHGAVVGGLALLLLLLPHAAASSAALHQQHAGASPSRLAAHRGRRNACASSMKRADAEAGAAARSCSRRPARSARGAGDVEVHPRRRRSRTRDRKSAGGDRAALTAAADVLHVGDLASRAACGSPSGSGNGHSRLADALAGGSRPAPTRRRCCRRALRPSAPSATTHGTRERGDDR